MLYIIYSKSLITGYTQHGTKPFTEQEAQSFVDDLNNDPDYKGLHTHWLEPAFETKQRETDWIAFIKDHPELWEAGATEAEALAKIEVTRK